MAQARVQRGAAGPPLYQAFPHDAYLSIDQRVVGIISRGLGRCIRGPFPRPRPVRWSAELGNSSIESGGLPSRLSACAGGYFAVSALV